MTASTLLVVVVLITCLGAVVGQTNKDFVNNCPLANTNALASSGQQILNQREGSYQTYLRAFFPYSPQNAIQPPSINSGYVGRVWSSGRLYSNEIYPFSVVYHGANNAYSIPDAALQDPNTDTELHFVGPQTYRYRRENNGANGLSMQLTPGYPKLISATMGGAPSKVDAVMQLHESMYFLINDAKKEGYFYTEVGSLKETVAKNNPVKMTDLLQETGINIQAAVNYYGNLWIMYKNQQGKSWMAKMAFTPPVSLRLLSKVPSLSMPGTPTGVMTCAV